MSAETPGSIRFTLNGQRYELSRDLVESRLAGVAPEIIRKHAVRVNGTWFPVRQAFERATGVPRSEFVSHTARRHLAALGFEIHSQIEHYTFPQPGAAPAVTARPPSRQVHGDPEEWHTESNVQAAVVAALAGEGWRILSVANTSTKEPGVDIIAARDGHTAGVEVKGFPSRTYADSARTGQLKPTQPSTQAGHWYAGAVLAAMRLRGREPDWRSVIALPDFPRYRDLYAQTSGSLSAAGIEVWWVRPDGTVDRP